MKQFTLKILTFFVVTLLYSFVSAQTKLLVEYDVSSFASTAKATLIADKNFSVYEEGLNSKSGEVESEENSFVIGGLNYSKTYQDRANPDMVYLITNTFSNDEKENKFISDIIPAMNWEISGAEKNLEIQGF